jgi:hypothetical protein
MCGFPSVKHQSHHALPRLSTSNTQAKGISPVFMANKHAPPQMNQQSTEPANFHFRFQHNDADGAKAQSTGNVRAYLCDLCFLCAFALKGSGVALLSRADFGRRQK